MQNDLCDENPTQQNSPGSADKPKPQPKPMLPEEMVRRAADLARARPRLIDKTGRRRIIDLTGLTFGFRRADSYNGDEHWNCTCILCGTSARVQTYQLLAGCQIRCNICNGIHKSIHGHTRRANSNGKKQTRTYQAWYSMHTRCRCPGSSAFEYYGGRGISVCPRWASFEAFLEDMREVPDGQWLDRKDGDEPYEPGNCRWATPEVQRRNQKRNHFCFCLGVKMIASDAAQLMGFHPCTLTNWLRKNPDFHGDVSQLYFETWRNRKKLTWNRAGF